MHSKFRKQSDCKKAPLAQLVEQLTLNQWVQGSNPWRCTKESKFICSPYFLLCLEFYFFSYKSLSFRKKAISLHSQFRNRAIAKAPLAQLVEQLTLNQWVQGSNPWRCTKESKFICSPYFYTVTKVKSHLALQSGFAI